MAEMKVCVQKQRKDGFWPVYIRVTHQRKVAYINTGKIAAARYVDKSGQVTDAYLMKMLGDKIIRYMEMLNHVELEKMSVKDVVAYLAQTDSKISFSQYARTYIHTMVVEGRERTAKNYTLALQNLELWAGSNEMTFEQMTSTYLNAWIDSLKVTKRAKEMYPVCIRQIWKDAMMKLNDEEKGVEVIKTYPWRKVDIPKADSTEKKAQTPEMLRKFFAQEIPASRMRYPLAELAKDVCMLSFGLAGMNSIDLYSLKKENYRDGVICYNRAKTQGKRADEAYMEMRVPDLLKPLIEKYKAPDTSDNLLNFAERLRNSDSFNANINIGIRKVCKLMGLADDELWDLYTFRHSWGTIARNDVRASMDDVAFAMNHGSAHKVTETYLKKDFSRAWELNEKVLDFVLNSEDPGNDNRAPEKLLETDRISKYNEMEGTAYYNGRMIAELTGNGYTNKKQIVDDLVKKLPDSIPVGARVQFVIVNLDKREKWMYEHQKGKGF